MKNHTRTVEAGEAGLVRLPASAMPLPCAGGFGDQPAALVDAFDVLEHIERAQIVERGQA